jgi:hypothetical protein
LSSQLFLKYNFTARKFCANFTLKSNKRQLFKNAEFFSYLAEFFSNICRQHGLGPGNSVRLHDISVAAITAAPLVSAAAAGTASTA